MLRKFTAGVLLCSMLACTSVQPVARPAAFIPQEQPEQVWVASPEGETFHLLRPTVRGDSVTGVLAATSEPFTVPMTPGSVVFAKQKSSSKTLQLVGGLGLLVGAAIVGAIMGGSGEKVCSQPGMRGCPPQ